MGDGFVDRFMERICQFNEGIFEGQKLVRWINLGTIFDYQIINPLFLGGNPKFKGRQKSKGSAGNLRLRPRNAILRPKTSAAGLATPPGYIKGKATRGS